MANLMSSSYSFAGDDYDFSEKLTKRQARSTTMVPKSKMSQSAMKPMKVRSTLASITKLDQQGVPQPEHVENEFKNKDTSRWKTIKKNNRIGAKLNFMLDRSCKVKQDLKSKRNVLMSELRRVPGLINNELIKYYYEPHKHDLTTDTEDFDLYEKMKTFQMEEKHEKHYLNVVNELILTEDNYIKGLDVLLNVYLYKIQTAQIKKIDTSVFVSMTQQVENMKKTHNEFLKQLKQAVNENAKTPFIGNYIVEFSPKLEDCSRYIFSYPQYLQQFHLVMADESVISIVNKGIEEFKKQSGVTDIQGYMQYLITPIQRVPRYVLFLTDILRHISISFADAETLIEAHKAIKKVATAINTKGHEYEADERMEFVEKLFTNFSAKKEGIKREFICCGPLYVVTDKVSLPTVWKYFFLFSDMLVITEVKSHQGKPVRERTNALYESLLRIEKLNDLQDSKFEIDQIIRLYDDTTVIAEEDTKFVHNMFTIKEQSNDLLCETISLCSTMSDCSIAWYTAIKSTLKHYIIHE